MRVLGGYCAGAGRPDRPGQLTRRSDGRPVCRLEVRKSPVCRASCRYAFPSSAIANLLSGSRPDPPTRVGMTCQGAGIVPVQRSGVARRVHLLPVIPDLLAGSIGRIARKAAFAHTDGVVPAFGLVHPAMPIRVATAAPSPHHVAARKAASAQVSGSLPRRDAARRASAQKRSSRAAFASGRGSNGGFRPPRPCGWPSPDDADSRPVPTPALRRLSKSVLAAARKLARARRGSREHRAQRVRTITQGTPRPARKWNRDRITGIGAACVAPRALRYCRPWQTWIGAHRRYESTPPRRDGGRWGYDDRLRAPAALQG